jgi:hypothetical protein
MAVAARAAAESTHKEIHKVTRNLLSDKALGVQAAGAEV